MVSRLSTLLALFAAFSALRAQSQTPNQPAAEEKGTYLGVLFSAVPEVLYSQLPALPHGNGVVANFILPESPAAQAGLQRHDILLQYDDVRIKDCEHFANLIRNDAPTHTVKLVFLRAGKEQTAKATLVLGPALKVAQNSRMPDKISEIPRATGKSAPGGVSVSVKPLDSGRVSVVVEFVDDGTGELRSIPWQRKTLEEVDLEIGKLPERVKPLALSAWTKVRDRLQQKDEVKEK
jgi:hypothetical protein